VHTGFWWADLIERFLQEVRWRVVNWTDLAQNRDRWRALVNEVMNLRIPLNARSFLGMRGPGGLSGRTLLHVGSYLGSG
jgi:hypothetical protein